MKYSYNRIENRNKLFKNTNLDFKDDFFDLNFDLKPYIYTSVWVELSVVKFENRTIMLVAAGLPLFGFVSGL